MKKRKRSKSKATPMKKPPYVFVWQALLGLSKKGWFESAQRTVEGKRQKFLKLVCVDWWLVGNRVGRVPVSRCWPCGWPCDVAQRCMHAKGITQCWVFLRSATPHAQARKHASRSHAPILLDYHEQVYAGPGLPTEGWKPARRAMVLTHSHSSCSSLHVAAIANVNLLIFLGASACAYILWQSCAPVQPSAGLGRTPLSAISTTRGVCPPVLTFI